MTRRLPPDLGHATKVTGVALGAPVPPEANEATHAPYRACGTCACCTSPHRPRERWTFRVRETHWGHVFLVWELTGNPRGRNEIGKRFVRWVK
jgi:hypothetical protein